MLNNVPVQCPSPSLVLPWHVHHRSLAAQTPPLPNVPNKDHHNPPGRLIAIYAPTEAPTQPGQGTPRREDANKGICFF